jgi:hypothetical protein
MFSCKCKGLEPDLFYNAAKSWQSRGKVAAKSWQTSTSVPVAVCLPHVYRVIAVRLLLDC